MIARLAFAGTQLLDWVSSLALPPGAERNQRFGIMVVAGKRRTEYDDGAPRMGLATRVAALVVGGQAPMLPYRPSQEIIDERTVKGPGCWTWTGDHNAGYPRMCVWGQGIAVVRLLFSMKYGPLPRDLVVRHLCDNPACVNPAHLTVGSHAENVADKVARNRQAKGERVHGVRLTAEIVSEIRWRHAHGESARGLGRAYAVDARTVTCLVKRKTWKHVP